MEKAFDFLSKHKDVAFATVEQDKPKIRVFQIMKQESHTLYFATSPHKEVHHQLKQNSNWKYLLCLEIFLFALVEKQYLMFQTTLQKISISIILFYRDCIKLIKIWYILD